MAGLSAPSLRGPHEARRNAWTVSRISRSSSSGARSRDPLATSRLQFYPRSGRALQLLGALAVIAAALLDPFQPAIGITGLVGVVLVDAGVHAGFAGGFLGIFRVDGVGEYRVAHRSRSSCGR